MQQDEAVVGGIGQNLPARLPFLAAAKLHDLTKQTKVRFVRDESKHDKIGVEAVQTVRLIRLPVRLRSRPSNVLHDFMLALTSDFVPRQYHRHLCPKWIFRLLLTHIKFQMLSQPRHELRPRRDTVGIKRFALRLRLASRTRFLAVLRRLLRASKSSTPLLIHLRSRCHAIDRHVQHLIRSRHSKQMIQIRENLGHHLVFSHSRIHIRPCAVRAVVNDTIHVQVQVIDPRDLISRDLLLEQRVALGEPSEKLRDAHRRWRL